MEKASIAKCAIALTIISAYTYLFGIMGTVEGSSVIAAEPATPAATTAVTSVTTEPPVTTSETTTEQVIQTSATYSTTINAENERKPGLADYTAAPDEIYRNAELIQLAENALDLEATPAVEIVIDELEDEPIPNETTDSSGPSGTLPTTSAVDEELPEYSETTLDTTLPAGELAPDETDVLDGEELEAEPEVTAAATTAATSAVTVPTATPAVTTVTPAATTDDELEADEDESLVNEANDAGAQTFTVNNQGTLVTGTALELVSRVVQKEIGSSFSYEAIKAQAVATYTYLKHYVDRGSAAYCVLASAADSRVVSAVKEVMGQALYYNGALIQAVYCASTAGYTASSYNVWGVDYAYLQSRECTLDAQYDPNYNIKKKFSSAEIKAIVKQNTGIELSGDPSEWFVIVNYKDSVYVGDMTIGGQSSFTVNGKTYKCTGKVFRETVMDYALRSHCFDIEYNADTDVFTITTRGYGHGCGLSQWGSNFLATYWNYDYLQILDFYYHGASVY